MRLKGLLIVKTAFLHPNCFRRDYVAERSSSESSRNEKSKCGEARQTCWSSKTSDQESNSLQSKGIESNFIYLFVTENF